jgi:hypothetical protein
VLEDGLGVHQELDDDPPERDFVTAASELSALALGEDEPGGLTGMGAWAMPAASTPGAPASVPSAPAPTPDVPAPPPMPS